MSIFPKTIFVAIEKGRADDKPWLAAEKSLNDVSTEIGEEKQIAEYRLVVVKTFKGVLKEI